jgi:hypothetical protein
MRFSKLSHGENPAFLQMNQKGTTASAMARGKRKTIAKTSMCIGCNRSPIRIYLQKVDFNFGPCYHAGAEAIDRYASIPV